jgi:hypothetical protein
MKINNKIVLFCLAVGLFVTTMYFRVQERERERARELAIYKEFHKPVTDWDKFYKALKDGETSKVFLRIAIASENEGENEYHIFLVDGDRWYLIDSNDFRGGCGGYQPVKRMYVQLRNLREHLHFVPSDEAKIVVVGDFAPKLRELSFYYPGEEKP